MKVLGFFLCGALVLLTGTILVDLTSLKATGSAIIVLGGLCAFSGLMGVCEANERKNTSSCSKPIQGERDL